MERAAKAAFPRECCGLIEGITAAAEFRATALYPARNLAAAPDRFEIDPAGRIAAAKSARARGRRIIGCYHSHPGGDARPSPHDLSGAAEENFLWLIAATDGMECRLAGFITCPSGFAEIALDRGADLVASSLHERN
jgi:proteasome lid subunit RPN8/RPN11